jgi:hypothetical protein
LVLGKARALVYGKLQSSRFVTDRRSRLLVGPRPRLAAQGKLQPREGLLPLAKRAAGHFYLDRYCFFGRGTYKVMAIPLRTQHRVHRAYNWTGSSIPPSGVNDIGTQTGSGGP